jgi:hypothetical protein
MRRAFIVLAAVFYGWTAFAYEDDGAVVQPAIVASSPTYIVNQNFEGTGYDNAETWTEVTATDGTVNEDYTTAAIADAQSLYVSEGTGGDVYVQFDLGADYSHLWAKFRFRVITPPGMNTPNRLSLAFRNSSGNAIGTMLFSWTNPNLYANAAIGTTNGTATSWAYSSSTAIYAWVEVDTDADFVKVWVNDSDSKPTGDGTKFAQQGTGVGGSGSVSTMARYIRLYCDYPSAGLVYDSVQVAAESFE